MVGRGIISLARLFHKSQESQEATAAACFHSNLWPQTRSQNHESCILNMGLLSFCEYGRHKHMLCLRDAAQTSSFCAFVQVSFGGIWVSKRQETLSSPRPSSYQPSAAKPCETPSTKNINVTGSRSKGRVFASNRSLLSSAFKRH